MALQDEIDLSDNPITITVGFALDSMLQSWWKDIKSVVEYFYGVELPHVRIDESLEVDDDWYELQIFGMSLVSGNLINGTEDEQRVDFCNKVSDALLYNMYLLDPDYLYNVLDLEKKKRERNWKGYQDLYYFYTKVEIDRSQAFHWLKKMAAMNIPWAINRLSYCYENGRGCKADHIQSKKVLLKIDHDNIFTRNIF